MKRIKSFTVLELLIVLIISSLLIFLSLSLLINFQSYFQKTLKEQAIGNEILWFQKTFKDDIYKADYLTGNSEIIRIYKDQKMKSYEIFEDRIVINTIDYTDTISLKINSIDIDYIENRYITYIELYFEYGNSSFYLTQNKTYDAKYLFGLMRKD